MLRDAVALNDTVSRTVAARGIPDAIELVTDSGFLESEQAFSIKLSDYVPPRAILYYRNLWQLAV